MRRFVSCLVAVVACAPQSPPLAPADSVAVLATQSAFVHAWLRDDTTAVLTLLDSGVVLLPPGSQAINGHNAVRDYWWPRDGSRTRITAFDWTTHELAGTGSLAYIRGISSLAWTYDKDSLHQVMSAKSQSLILLRRRADGRWLISRQTWSPASP